MLSNTVPSPFTRAFMYVPEGDLSHTANIIGYIPLVGTVSGFFRILVMLGIKTTHWANTPKDVQWTNGHIARGFVELIPVAGGITLIISDIFNGIRYRMWSGE
jgi:hypothetical protein